MLGGVGSAPPFPVRCLVGVEWSSCRRSNIAQTRCSHPESMTLRSPAAWLAVSKKEGRFNQLAGTRQRRVQGRVPVSVGKTGGLSMRRHLKMPVDGPQDMLVNRRAGGAARWLQRWPGVPADAGRDLDVQRNQGNSESEMQGGGVDSGAPFLVGRCRRSWYLELSVQWLWGPDAAMHAGNAP